MSKIEEKAKTEKKNCWKIIPKLEEIEKIKKLKKLKKSTRDQHVTSTLTAHDHHVRM